MCGIFALLNNNHSYTQETIETEFKKGAGRGPENSKLIGVGEGDKLLMGFHRLAINGVDEISHQPLFFKNVGIICNGEIYNYKELYQLVDTKPTTNSDCEVIIHLYLKFGMEYTLQLLDGVFAFVLADVREDDHNDDHDWNIYIARDPYGVRPLYQLSSSTDTEYPILFGSEMKMLHHFYENVPMYTGNTTLPPTCYGTTLNQFPPGTYSKMNFNKVHNNFLKGQWEFEFQHETYSLPGFTTMDKYLTPIMPLDNTLDDTEYRNILHKIHDNLDAAVAKRVANTDRPVACLLSGGLDSSLITSLVVKHCKYKPETYSIGLPGSEDNKYAKLVADHLGTKHTTIQLTEDEFFEAIPKVIHTVESYDTTTIRASVGNYLVAKYISEHSDAKVIFNGDGSDELCGGYMYFHCAPDAHLFDQECRRLLKDIYKYDVQRSDRSISTNGLEPRTPFLDRSWVQFYLSIPVKYRYHVGNKQCEKHLLRTAFAGYNVRIGKPYLPEAVLWRTKEAFSDGVSGKAKSWYEIIGEKITAQYGESFDTIPEQYTRLHNAPQTKEQYYYRFIFESHYKGMGHVIPYFWMPKFVDATDSSARTLQVYQTAHEQEHDTT